MRVNIVFVLSVFSVYFNWYVTGNTEERLDMIEKQLSALQTFIMQVILNNIIIFSYILS